MSTQKKAELSLLLVNGEAGLRLPADDLGVLHGLGVFETMRTYGERFFRLDAHLNRLEHSAETMGISFDRSVVRREIEMGCGLDVAVRYTLTASGHRILQRRPIDPDYIARPRVVAPIDWRSPIGLPGSVKHTSRAPWLVTAQALGVDELLLCDPQGRVLEASRSNVFAILEGRLKTPPLDDSFLEGVTRGALLDAAAHAGIDVECAHFSTWEPFEALYLSSTLKEFAPVEAIGEQEYPTRHPLGEALYAAFRALVERECG